MPGKPPPVPYVYYPRSRSKIRRFGYCQAVQYMMQIKAACILAGYDVYFRIPVEVQCLHSLENVPAATGSCPENILKANPWRSRLFFKSSYVVPSKTCGHRSMYARTAPSLNAGLSGRHAACLSSAVGYHFSFLVKVQRALCLLLS